MALKYGGELDWRAMRWLIAERMHWPLDYVDSLDAQDVLDGLHYWQALKVLRDEQGPGEDDVPAIMRGLVKG